MLRVEGGEKRRRMSAYIGEGGDRTPAYDVRPGCLVDVAVALAPLGMLSRDSLVDGTAPWT